MIRTFLLELKRRRVVRAALIYGAGAFATLQAVAVLVPALHLPLWLITAVAVLAIAGLPLALALSWAFDITPRGLTRAGVMAVPAAPQTWVGRRTVLIVAVLLVFGGGLGAGWFLRPAAVQVPANGPITVAVLPFQNLSGDAATEPFVLGVHDDLLTQLSRLGALRVISRTSVMEYRDRPMSIRQIATDLGARAVVEGGVQRAGERIRLNVQLIDARTDAHLWAQTYDRALTAENVFAIQADIARSIAHALRAELVPAENAVLDETPTTNLAALEAWHSGRAALFTGSFTGLEFQVAPRMFERAVEFDPEFAEAWAGLASARSWLVRNGELADTSRALEALDRARALAPRATATRLAEAYVRYYAHADLPRARAAFRAVLETAPANSEAIRGLANVERRLGNLPEATRLLRESVRLDPRNTLHLTELAWTLALIGEPEEAIPLLEKALRLNPVEMTASATMFGVLLWELGDTAAARRFAGESLLSAGEQGPTWRTELALVRRDWPAAADAAGAVVRVGFWSYGGYYVLDPPLRLAKLAWLTGDRAAVARWTARSLADADSIAASSEATDDRWGGRTDVHLRRALAYAFRGDTARALAAAAEAARYPVERDVLTGTVVLDHLVIVDIVTGRHQQAIDGIERLLSMPSMLKPARLRLDPIYDALRDDPRFRMLSSERR